MKILKIYDRAGIVILKNAEEGLIPPSSNSIIVMHEERRMAKITFLEKYFEP